MSKWEPGIAPGDQDRPRLDVLRELSYARAEIRRLRKENKRLREGWERARVEARAWKWGALR